MRIGINSAAENSSILGIYREKPIIATIAYTILCINSYIILFTFDKNIFILSICTLIFHIYCIVSSLIILYSDRIEIINPLAKKTIHKRDIEKIETRTRMVRGMIYTESFLIEAGNPTSPTLLPRKFKMDAAWLEWMAPIPEVTIDGWQRNTLKSIILAILVMTAAYAVMTLPLTTKLLKPFFDVACLIIQIITIFLCSKPAITYDYFERSRFRQNLVKPAGIFFVLLLSVRQLLEWGPFGQYIISKDSFPLSCISLILAAAVFTNLKTRCSLTINIKNDALIMLMLITCIFGYSAGLTINSIFDDSMPQRFFPRIVNKYAIVKGKNRGKYFTLAPWGPETTSRTYRPSDQAFNALGISGTVCAKLHAGFIDVQWYKLSDACD